MEGNIRKARKRTGDSETNRGWQNISFSRWDK
jgi:hypothetical protein